MNEKLYTPQEAADILKVRKNTVYEMIKRGSLKATKMGKQLRITESDLTQIINPSEPSNEATMVSHPSFLHQAPEHNAILCGQDIVLDMLCSKVNSNLGKSHFIRSYDGSYNGLLSLYKDEVTIASAHLWDHITDSYNLPFIPKLLPGENVHVYHILNRPVGFYVAKNNPKNIVSIKDLNQNDIKIVNREKGSGIRILFDSLLLNMNIDPSSITGYNRIVNSHLAAAAMISKGGADWALGNKNVALQFPTIDFIHLKNEQYDIAIKDSSMKSPEIQDMIATLQSTAFQDEVDSMGLYDVTDMGKRLM